MKISVLIFGVIFSNILLAQNLQYINFGKVLPKASNTCLVVNAHSKELQKDPSFNDYNTVETIKLTHFNDDFFSVDSIIELMKPLTNIKKIIFDNCDLTACEKSFEQFSKLQAVSFINKSSIYENTLFPLLKNNVINTLQIQTTDSDVSMDSLYLLKNIKNMSISSNALFLKSNKEINVFPDSTNTNISYTLNYYGDFYKNEPSKIKIQAEKTLDNAISYSHVSNLECMKQPLPGIKINDTIFKINSATLNNFTYQSGSQITIANNAFITDDGKSYTGNATVFYREFRTPVEIMLSGIPMINTENGETQQFKSGGMYQINAFDTNNKPLKAKNDSVIQIKFAMTDTSSSFKFYSLNNNGSWATKTNSISSVSGSNGMTVGKMPKAVFAYFSFLRNIPLHVADTTNYNARFYSDDYAYVFRKDNFGNKISKKDTTLKINTKKEFKTIKKENVFKVKYYKQTKDKQIVFKIAPYRKYNYLPNYILNLFDKTFLYTGDLSKAAFKNKFNRGYLFWDLRTNSNDNNLNLDLKASNKHEFISGELISLRDDRTYVTRKNASKFLNTKINRSVRISAKRFNHSKKTLKSNYIAGTRYDYHNKNDLNNYAETHNVNYEAYKSSLKKQTKEEEKLSYKEFVKYAEQFRYLMNGSFGNRDTSVVAFALLQSGLGVKNIDCYIHSGEMENILVNYKNTHKDSLENQMTTILYPSINTSYQLFATDKGYFGYYFKNKDNIIIRFKSTTMQVTKPSDVVTNKAGKNINLNMLNQFDVKNLNSNDITKLIMN